ncbi:MAG: hypothetical protein ACR2PH_01760, partial [Desulfobulbia bacterium]
KECKGWMRPKREFFAVPVSYQDQVTELPAEADELCRNVKYLELTLEQDFQHELVAATQFPHMEDEFQHLDGNKKES